MNANQFLDYLESKGLLTEKVLATLRKQVEKKASVTPDRIVKALLQNGHLTQAQSTTIVDEARNSMKKPSESEDLLDLAPDPDEEPKKKTTAPKPKPEPKKTAPKKQTKQQPQKSPAKKPAPAEPVLDEADLIEDEPEIIEDLVEVGAPGGLAPLAPGELMGEIVDESALVEATPAETGDVLTEELSSKGSLPPGFKKKEKPENQWDSMLMIGGGLLLGLQLLAFGFLFISLTTNTQTEMYTRGKNDYDNGSFSPAAAKLKKYLEDYPNDENSSKARVMIQMASLHEVLGDPEVALERSRKVLAAIVDEEQFPEIRPEFIVILPDMYEAFVDMAIRSGVAAEQKKLLDQASETLRLINNVEYIPDKQTILKRLKSIEEKVGRVQREIEEDGDLVQAVAAIEKALTAKQTATAWQTRRNLLNQYPGLRQREELLKATEQIITAERALVSVSARNAPAAKDDPSPPQAGVAGATVAGSPIPSLEGEVAYVLVRDRVYGIDVATGKPLWQRALGKGTNLPPTRISNDPGADGLICDIANKSLMRVRAKTGEVVWRANIGVEFAMPVVDGERIILSSQAGLLEIDAISGASSNLAEFPLPLSVGVCHDPSRQVYYQIADNSNLYAISKDGFECSEVYYVGHRSGQVVAPPVTIVGLILVPQNINQERSLLKVLKTNESGLRIQQAQTAIQLEGRIIAPPVVFGHRVLVVTDRRGIHVFDIEVGEQVPVYEVATIKASESSPRTMFPLVKDSHLWVGSNNISKYVVQASKQQIVPQFTESDGNYLAGLQSFGNFVLDVRQPKTRLGSVHMTLNALGAAARSPIWEVSFDAAKTSSTAVERIQVANR